MKYLSMFLLSFCLMTISMMAQEDKASTIKTDDIQVVMDESGEKPVMTFESMEVDFGTIDKGSEPVRTLKFTNTGDAPLIIKQAKGSCGCTVPTVPKEPILPGQSDVIKVRYDTNRVGPIRKTVRITTNEGDTPHILQVVGHVNAAADKETMPVKEGGLTE